NPGNSGGALVDNQGRLVGINSIIASYSGSSAGVGFAIPVNYAVKVANKIIAGESVDHAFMGVSVHTVTARNVEQDNLSVNQGAYVGSVTAGGPAEQAGILPGDVVIKVGRENIASADALILAVRSYDVGETVDVIVVRGEERLTLQVTLGSDLAPQGAGSEADQSQDNREAMGN
ncbi:MAG: PDZ domain-containing protein, partial [Atopobiaceae bacterium]|nr:PDZ domain-containing protein [Atopobiaceae bacterium]